MMWAAVALGGAIGAVARHALNVAVLRLWSAGTFPTGIFMVNAVGCLVIGVLAGALASNRVHVGETGRTFLIVGILGGFTTFSSYTLDTYTLLRGGQPGLALANAGGQVAVGLLALWLGFAAASWR